MFLGEREVIEFVVSTHVEVNQWGHLSRGPVGIPRAAGPAAGLSGYRLGG